VLAKLQLASTRLTATVLNFHGLSLGLSYIVLYFTSFEIINITILHSVSFVQ